jgi:TonB-dependent SusC/RagA subfamily outer membrane receptor
MFARVLRPLWLGSLLLVSVSCGGRNAFDEAASPTPERTPEDRSTITEGEIRGKPGMPIEELLAGRISGVHVSQSPDGGISVRIRGRNSFRADDRPLYVIDGVPINPGPGGALTGINPYDIESIRVLKDIGDTAEYGLRGANGVILIKTKGGD